MHTSSSNNLRPHAEERPPISGLPDIGLMGASRSMAAQAVWPRGERKERSPRPCFETRPAGAPQHEGGVSFSETMCAYPSAVRGTTAESATPRHAGVLPYI